MSHFDDPDFVRRYAEGPGRFVPGYTIMQRMAAQLIAERIGGVGEVLVLGAGGGLELEAFASARPGWRFLAVDPSAEMLNAARARAAACNALDRVRWVEGLIFDAPVAPCDAATCLLTLHFVPDDGGKLATLRAIHERLKPGAPFVLVDLCMDKAALDYQRHVDRYQRFALDSGADADDVAETVIRVKTIINTVPAARDEELLAEAGFGDAGLFYAGLSWRGWVAAA